MQSAVLQLPCGIPRSPGVNSRAIQYITAHPVGSQHGAAGSALHRRQRCMIARGIPVSGPAGSYSEEPPSVDPETARISAQTMDGMKEKIGEALETDRVTVTDTYGDGRHVSIDVVSPIFAGKSSVKRQQLVYKAIWLELQDTVHAVDSMTTKTPEEAGG